MNWWPAIISLFFTAQSFAQEERLSFGVSDGMIIVGYVDKGAFLNFTGPNINTTFNKSKILFGMLPSLRFIDDTGLPRNAKITPNLGIGLTYSYKRVAFQIPLYYNAKTATKEGKWNIGLGIGLRLNEQ